LKKVYTSVDDIDLSVGVLLETALTRSEYGPVGQCIVGEQFRNLKFGDRFYYSFYNGEASFTPAQLQSIRNVTSAGLFCVLQDPEQQVQIDIFHPESKSNPVRKCKDMPWMNYDLF